MEFDTDRRRFLELVGTGTAFSLAGCSALQEPEEITTETPAEETRTKKATVTAAIDIDQQKLQQRQQEIQSELQAGNISRTEAQQQFQKAKTTLNSQAVASFSERINSNSALTLRNSIDQFGVVLVSGAATGLINLLSLSEVRGLFPQSAFKRAKQQVEQQRETTTAPNSS